MDLLYAVLQMEIIMDNAAKPELSYPIALRSPKDVLADLEKIAGAADRTRIWVMVRAFRHYLASEEGARILRIIKGYEDIAAGDVHDMDDVIAELEDIV